MKRKKRSKRPGPDDVTKNNCVTDHRKAVWKRHKVGGAVNADQRLNIIRLVDLLKQLHRLRVTAEKTKRRLVVVILGTVIGLFLGCTGFGMVLFNVSDVGLRSDYDAKFPRPQPNYPSPNEAQFRASDGFTDWDKYRSEEVKTKREYEERWRAYNRAGDKYVAERHVPMATGLLASGSVFVLLFAAPIAALLLWKRMRFHRTKREVEFLTASIVQNYPGQIWLHGGPVILDNVASIKGLIDTLESAI